MCAEVRTLISLISRAAMAALWSFALASASPTALAQDQEDKEAPTGVPENSIARNFPKNGDPDGQRAALAARGITYGLNYFSEVFGNASGGIRQGARYMGLLEAVLDVDLEKLAGWRGLTFHAHGFQMHGHGISSSHVGLLNPVSGIEATPATRLFELWLEQELIKEKLSVRFGQMRVDNDGEFVNSQTANLLLNASFGWPAFMAVNLPSGGVSYPLAGMGVRVKYQPSEKWTVLAAVFNDDPAGPCADDPQRCNNDGLKFRVQDNPFVIGEVQYRYSDNKDPGQLKGQIKLGTFVDFGRFDHQRFGTDGLSLADPASSGTARRLRGDPGYYAVLDQQLYRSVRSGADANDGIHTFWRIAALPSDRNLVDFTVDGGLRFNGMIPGRPSDEFGFGFSYNRISSAAVGLDRDNVLLTGSTNPIRSDEWVAEITYKAEVMKGFYLQPDLQYVWRPGGGAEDPNRPGKRIEDALVLGLRGTISY